MQPFHQKIRISGCHASVDEKSHLLQRYAVLAGKYLQMFQRSIAPSIGLGLPGPEDGGIIIIRNVTNDQSSPHLLNGLHTPVQMGREQKGATGHALKHYKPITYIT